MRKCLIKVEAFDKRALDKGRVNKGCLSGEIVSILEMSRILVLSGSKNDLMPVFQNFKQMIGVLRNSFHFRVIGNDLISSQYIMGVIISVDQGFLG